MNLPFSIYAMVAAVVAVAVDDEQHTVDFVAFVVVAVDAAVVGNCSGNYSGRSNRRFHLLGRCHLLIRFVDFANCSLIVKIGSLC